VAWRHSSSGSTSDTTAPRSLARSGSPVAVRSRVSWKRRYNSLLDGQWPSSLLEGLIAASTPWGRWPAVRSPGATQPKSWHGRSTPSFRRMWWCTGFGLRRRGFTPGVRHGTASTGTVSGWGVSRLSCSGAMSGTSARHSTLLRCRARRVSCWEPTTSARSLGRESVCPVLAGARSEPSAWPIGSSWRAPSIVRGPIRESSSSASGPMHFFPIWCGTSSVPWWLSADLGGLRAGSASCWWQATVEWHRLRPHLTGWSCGASCTPAMSRPTGAEMS
jgi:hypothetical protein